MKKTYIVLLIVLAYVLGSLWYRFGRNESPPPTSDTASSTMGVSSSNGINTSNGKGPLGNTTVNLTPGTTVKNETYSNFQYGFAVRYPKSTKIEFPFQSFYHLGKDWRAGATPEYRGTGVISFVVYREDNQIKFPKKYPLYYSTEVRVGVSTDTANCYQRDAGYTNQPVTTVTFNGITFKKFSSSQAGMMQYSQVESYRTIHNKLCYAIEQVKAGSNYTDSTFTGISTPESVLTNAYTSAGTILKSFTFTK